MTVYIFDEDKNIIKVYMNSSVTFFKTNDNLIMTVNNDEYVLELGDNYYIISTYDIEENFSIMKKGNKYKLISEFKKGFDTRELKNYN